ncbi:hypothetical protein C1I98_12860 [Spongiactinospora gelatinilytica]|uniref:Uncharacterized protein n=1 Tax=Spongiactinospora gelatinilytica TaxID=2666298 RepID=A0A2W2HQ68_9ACTN|nr:hypothetical protein [Spongiactinospora gelatinilytica]PZG48087.1 hypothetical protein C1I98_12860 [Spongiactinospora gelatinilytica]
MTRHFHSRRDAHTCSDNDRTAPPPRIRRRPLIVLIVILVFVSYLIVQGYDIAMAAAGALLAGLAAVQIVRGLSGARPIFG